MIYKKIKTESSKYQLLFIDNNSDFLDTRAEFLEKTGFVVLRAYSVEQAHQILDRSRVHIAILDLRMVDDNDERDVSGLMLAQDQAFRHIPKLILTGFPSTEKVREVLRIQPDGTSIALDFLDKKDGPDAMIKAVNLIIGHHLNINKELKIFSDGQGPNSFRQLANLIEIKNDFENLSNPASEFEDLFRNLFHDFDQITLSKSFWHTGKQACIGVYAYSKNKEENFVVTFGFLEENQTEQEINKASRPMTNVFDITYKTITAETQRFAATALSFPKVDIEDMLRFSDYYFRQPKRQVCSTLEHLYNSTLSPWYKQSRNTENKEGHDGILTNHAGINLDFLSPDDLRTRIQALVESTVALKDVIINISSGKLEFQLAKSKKVTCPDPTIFLYRDDIFSKPSMEYVTTPGILNMDSVLVDRFGKSWLTDFTHTQVASIWQDFVSLETDIHFKFMETHELFTLIDFEEQLLNMKRLTESISLNYVLPDCKKAFSAIQMIRKLAAQFWGDNLLSYYNTLLFYSANAFVTYDPDVRYTKREVLSLTHRLLFIALLCKRIALLQKDYLEEDKLTAVEMTLVVDSDIKNIRIGRKTINLTPTEFDLLNYLFIKDEKLCTREEILEHVFKYEGTNIQTDASLINTNIARLREKIEIFPGRHEFIQTKRGQGYILHSKPKQSLS